MPFATGKLQFEYEIKQKIAQNTLEKYEPKKTYTEIQKLQFIKSRRNKKK